MKSNKSILKRLTAIVVMFIMVFSTFVHAGLAVYADEAYAGDVYENKEAYDKGTYEDETKAQATPNVALNDNGITALALPIDTGDLGGGVSWTLYNNGHLAIRGAGGNLNLVLPGWPWQMDVSPFHNIRYQILTIEIEDDIIGGTMFGAPSFTNSSLTSMFNGLTNLTEIIGLEKIDTTNVWGMNRMFMNTHSLQSLDLSSWNMSNVGGVMHMFDGAHSLQHLDFPSSWNASSTTNLRAMFNDTHSLQNVDFVTNWDVSNVWELSGLFRNARSVQSLNVANWDTSTAGSIQLTFSGMDSLTSLDLSGWDTSNATGVVLTGTAAGMGGMLNNLPSLKQITLGENFVFTTRGPSNLPNANLPNPPNNATYTGYWINLAGGTPSNPLGTTPLTALELMQTYNGATMADVWAWQPRTMHYEITFMTNDGTGAIHETKTVPEGTSLLTVPAPLTDPVRAGYTFTSWDSQMDGNGFSFSWSTLVTSNINVYAQWQPVWQPPTDPYFTVNVRHMIGGDYTNATLHQTISHRVDSALVGLLHQNNIGTNGPNFEGIFFDRGSLAGHTLDLAGSFAQRSDGENLAYYLDIDWNVSGVVMSTQHINETLANWTLSAPMFPNAFDYVVTLDIFVNFEPIPTFEITIQNGGTNHSPTTPNNTFTAGDIITLAAGTREGYTFVNWG
ncbi:MAG: BspA family leucine-rich repeat surface protein, partial [Defluviitaleaceae bacterium]|nr:BspA family leucine-rich repeat surface protein [Defluviitaleaceae bacterium]